MTPLGYAVRIPDERGRKSRDEIVFYDRYGSS